MTRGRITITGNAGMHLGAYMKGGAIEVSGNASDWVGAEMSGGLIRIGGNAGGQVGAAYRGSLSGMTDGTILVGGAAGLEVGMRMKRGIIAVGGPVRDFAGLQMKGGTHRARQRRRAAHGRVDDARHDHLADADSAAADLLVRRPPMIPAFLRLVREAPRPPRDSRCRSTSRTAPTSATQATRRFPARARFSIWSSSWPSVSGAASDRRHVRRGVRHARRARDHHRRSRREWARTAAQSMTGFATSVIGCKVEAGIEAELAAGDTPDGRPGVSVLVFGFDAEGLGTGWSSAWARRCSPARRRPASTACRTRPSASIVGGVLRHFGDKFQSSKVLDGRRYWRMPVMEGEFLVEETFGVQKAIGGGNLLILAKDQDAGAGGGGGRGRRRCARSAASSCRFPAASSARAARSARSATRT